MPTRDDLVHACTCTAATLAASGGLRFEGALGLQVLVSVKLKFEVRVIRA